MEGSNSWVVKTDNSFRSNFSLQLTYSMSQTHHRAGYQLQAIQSYLRGLTSPVVHWEDVLHRACAFTVQWRHRPEPDEGADPILAVARNIVTRGTPTLPSCYVEATLADALGMTTFDDSENAGKAGHYRYVAAENASLLSDHGPSQSLLAQAFALADPRLRGTHLNDTYTTWEKHDSNSERRFHLDVASQVGCDGLAQHLEPQTPMASVLRQTQRERDKLERSLQKVSDHFKEPLATDFYRQRVDFTLSLPELSETAADNPSRWVIEVDGSQHQDSPQQALDKRRDRACRKRGWEVCRIPTSNVQGALSVSQSEAIQTMAEHPWMQRVDQNMKSPLYETEDGRKALQAALVPIAVARIQHVLIDLMRSGDLDLRAPEWSIAIIERDVPCARLAIEDLFGLLETLRTLQEGTQLSDEERMPEVQLRIYGTTAFEDCALREAKTINLKAGGSSESSPEAFRADVLLDVSVLQHTGWSYPNIQIPDEVTAQQTAEIRSAHSDRLPHPIATAPPITYHLPSNENEDVFTGSVRENDDESESAEAVRPVTTKNPVLVNRNGPTDTNADEEALIDALASGEVQFSVEETYESDQGGRTEDGGRTEQANHKLNQQGTAALERLLQDIFRKASFREGQVEILCRTLQRESTIALLPTGAGKSLTYQMAALLQPGVTLVVDPIKSLMRDQTLNLQDEGIDAVTYINSGLSTRERYRRLEAMEHGAYLILFVSPERLMIPSFRDRLSTMKGKDIRFTHCTIDEAHCVSEWGHDFRATYLRLGANARRLLHTGDENEIPLLALTGTASFDVLEDVRRELALDELGNEGTITPKTFRRDELNFRVHKVEVPNQEKHSRKQDSSDSRGANSFEIKASVGKAKHDALTEVLDKLPDLFDDSDPQSFYSTQGEDSNGGIIFTPHRSWVFGASDVEKHLRHEYPPLNGRTDYYHGTDSVNSNLEDQFEEAQDAFKSNDITVLAATKAFGMGIDKSNVRFTIHLNMPQSIESFYQEAGRAGRDRDDAYCIVLYCPDSLAYDPETDEAVSIDKDLMLSFHRNSFRGQDHEMRMLDDVLTDQLHIEEDTVHPSVEDKLDNMAAGSSSTLYISFQNHRVRHLSDYLGKQIDGKWGVGIVNEARSFTHTYDAFVDNLIDEVEKRNWTARYSGLARQLDEEIRTDETARFFFETIREQEDTFRVVHRLSLIGAVQDFWFHYGKELVEVRLRKRTEDEYIDHLCSYLARYMAPADVQQAEEDIRNSNQPTAIRRCAERLVAFVYGRIKRKRRMAIDNMERAIEDGAPADDPFGWIEGSTDRDTEDDAKHSGQGPDADNEEEEATPAERFEEGVYTFFDSKFLTGMREHLRESYNTDLLWRYIDETAGAEVELRHLRGACDRLLEDNPDHAVFLLLRAYAEVLLPDGRIERAQNDVQAASNQFAQVDKEEELTEVTERFLRAVRSQHPSAEEHLATIILPLHHSWMQSFLREGQLGAFAAGGLKA